MVKGFSRAQMSLHWAVALLILFQLIFFDGMSKVWDTFSDTGVATLTTAASAHVIVPAAPAGESAPMNRAGAVGRWALYVLMLAMPITGLMTWFGGFTSLSGLHADILQLLLILLIFVRVATHRIIRYS